MTSVYIEDNDKLIEGMFRQRGWDIADDPDSADLICFGGGADVAPMLYLHEKLPTTICDYNRDQRNTNLYLKFYGEKPMVGICRGGQFLNVMNDGEMIQDVRGHGLGSGTHEAYDPDTGQSWDVTSAHHQMMVPSEDGEILLVADVGQNRKPSDDNFANDVPEQDVEAVLYDSSQCLCFQPHPEYVDKDHECQVLFFDMLKEFLEMEAK